ncbi:hypothetical protein SNE40_016179 [Patella caerulea]|uniref:AAA+ ATPase domain-containing protein n=1 Tax=Patella caerulea TaxID=87958 RepID=A0AAN8J898_PATCE
MDDRLKWLETRITSSLRPRNEDLKNMFLNDENRLAFYEFINNEDVKRLYVYKRPPRNITASQLPPYDLQSKCIFFLKCNSGTKLAKDNMDQEVFYMDCTALPLEHLELTIREVFLPLLGINQPSVTGAGINGDKLMDILHRLMAAVEITQGHVEGRIVLNLPSIEVLAEAASAVNRRSAVLHVLETTVIGWIKQIRTVLRHDPPSDLLSQFGAEPGPLEEIKMWEKQLERLQSVNSQLDSDVARDILHNLEQANSQYAHSFNTVRKDIDKAVIDTNKILNFLSTMRQWFDRLHESTQPADMLILFKPLMTSLLLVWTHSTYYHQIDKFHNLLRLLSNEVVHRAIAMVGADILREPLESYTKLKDALKVCAAFRGTYLDFKDRADDQNAQNIAENAERLAARPQGSLFMTKMYGPHAYTPRYGIRKSDGDSSSQTLEEDELWTDSPWPPRNAPSFDLLNSFMERCNDVLELVETTRHFRLLAGAAEVGGAGSMSLDAMVKEIHQKYTLAMNEFFSVVDNVLSIDGSQSFERCFFKFRTVVKGLEKRLAGILRQAFSQCPTVEAQLRLLEVFEGVSSRELVQAHLKDKDAQLVEAFTAELIQVKDMFADNSLNPPLHYNMPPIVSRLMWVHALRERIRIPMEKLRQVSPHSLEGDTGWQMRDTYNGCQSELESYENKMISDWQNNITAELTLRLKQPLLTAEDYDEDIDIRPQVVHVNLDPQLLLLLREIRYLGRKPFNIKLPEGAKELIRNTDSFELSVTATRLETIVSKYNTIMKTITSFERPMFERKLAKIDHLFEQGLQDYTWKMKESTDFIETAMSLVCLDVHQNLDIVQTNCHDIVEITISWAKNTLDVFRARDPQMSYPMEELLEMQSQLADELENVVLPSGNKIHQLVSKSFEAVQISEASPAWQDYIDYIDAIVLDGLKQATLTSLMSMLNTLVQANMAETEIPGSVIPILTIRLELIDNNVSFCPPLDQNTSVVSVQELVQKWLDSYLARGVLVKMLGNKGTYQDYIEADDEVRQLLSNIHQLVDDNSLECKKLLEVFKDYSFLWLRDVNETFEEFLQGIMTPNPLRTPNRSVAAEMRNYAAEKSTISRASSQNSIGSAGLMGTAERSFLTPKGVQNGENEHIPSLDEFDAEIDIYKTARDEIQDLKDYHDEGWIRVDLQPIKQVLTTYASKWMWTFTKYLSNQVSDMLEKLDLFLKRIEPEIESITGDERDTASFMKMMRLFNEVSAQQNEMDGKFTAMHRTMILLKKYGQTLNDKTQFLFNAAPGRWNSLKTKVSLAKQRLGPRIQEESARITQDLEAFANRVYYFNKDMENSDVYSRDCNIPDAWISIDTFSKKLHILENEAQDLIELQELLESSVVNFSVLPQCRIELTNLKQLWEKVRVIEEQQTEWKRHRWQKMNTKFLREETNKQLAIVRGLPEDVFTWDVYMGLHESITTIQSCLPLIDDLSNPAMRTRHWKQLVRVTGGALTIDNDMLKRMTLGELLSLGLQKHVDDVRAIVQRAAKDLTIEQSLKTYEEVWLSKVFELRSHIRTKSSAAADTTIQDNQSEVASEVGGTQPSRSQVRATSRVSNQSSHSRLKRTSIASLPASLLNLGEDTGSIQLLLGTDPIFEELEGHQVSLQTMQSSSAAGSFLDEVMKWQKRLQTIEAVLTTWLDVQEKWVELEEIYSGADIKTSLSHDANRFSQVNRDFRLLMRATEKNPNVLQCCSRKNILSVLENMNDSLESCRRSLLNHLERRRQMFPRFYFLSMEDVLHIVCNGYDLNQVNIYINKLFSHVDKLLFEETDEENEKFNFIINGVQSKMGENLLLQQPVACEGQLETWMTALLNSIKTTLQHQTSTSLLQEKQKNVRNIQSAGARKVPVKASPSSSLTKVNKEEAAPSRGPSQESVHSRGEASDSRPSSSVKEVIQGTQLAERSWTLDHVKEIVYLTTKIQLTDYMNSALKDLEQGQREALQDAVEKIERSIIATTILLKGLEGEQENESRKLRAKTTDRKESQAGFEKEQDTMSDSVGVSVVPSIKGSMADVMAESARAGEEQETNEGTRTADTMNLTMEIQDSKSTEAKPVTVSTGEVVDEVDKVPEDLRLLLFPCQIDKLTSILALLAHQRDMISRLIDVSRNASPAKSFDWRSQLQYSYLTDNKTVKVKCLDAEFDYGYEYLGAANHEILTPVTERMFVTLTQAVKAHIGSLCVGPAESDKERNVEELSRCLGYPHYSFNCTATMNHFQLHDIFHGMAATGCWVSFNSLNYCQPAILSIFAQLMSTVMAALQAGKAAVHLVSDDIQLNHNGACFAHIDSAVPVTPRNPDKMLIYMSASANLPDDVLKQFRIISAPKPDTRLAIEVLLFSEGFVNGKTLANKVLQLQDLWCKLFGTNTYITENVALGYDRSSSIHGWSLHTLKAVVREAGANLEAALSESYEKDSWTVDIREKHENEDQEKDGEVMMSERKEKIEDEALVQALRDTFLPRMQARDASIFSTLVSDYWPGVEVPMTFDGEGAPPIFKSESLEMLRSEMRLKTAKSQDSQKSLKDSLNLNTPVVNLTGIDQYSSLHSHRNVLEDIQDAIAVATADLGLLPGSSFQSRVVQLAHLNLAHKTIIVVGPPGCGKSECIKTFAVAERERGKTITVQSVFTKAVESEELMGFVHPKTKEWKEGLMTSLLRKFCIKPSTITSTEDNKPVMKIMQLDGEADRSQMELLQQLLDHNGSVVLANNERLIIPDSLRFIWELGSLENLSPSLLANVGVLVMSEADVGWKILLVQWLEHRPDTDKDFITSLCNIYIEKVVDYITQCTQPPMFGCKETSGQPRYKRLLCHTIENMVHTFCVLFETLINPFPELSDVECERYFNFACIWAFAGTLSIEHRESFSYWWKETFEHYIDYPEEGTVFDYLVDNDSHEFSRWCDNLPTYSGVPHTGIPSEAFVHTVNVEQILYIVGLLTDAGRPVMLVGENGCGKTSIVNERIRTVCSGEVAEVLSLTLYANTFTNAKLVYERLDERLEWKHGRTYVPRGNKRLLFLIDDLNLSKVDEFGNQTAAELVREHLDDGGFYSATSHSWRYVKNVTYVTTINPNTTATSTKLSHRLLRHFSIFGCPYPRSNELETIFSTLVNTHFIAHEPSSSHHGGHDEKMLREEEKRRRLIGLVVSVTVELQDRLRTMFLPTAQRCHYIFTIRDLSVIFKNVCLSLRPGCSKSDLLLLWQHECFWVYGHRMVNEVDIRRFRQALFTAVRKQFTDEEQMHDILKPQPRLFSNLIEQDSGIVTAGMVDARQTSNVSEEDALTDLYKSVNGCSMVEELMEKGVEEYNKVHPSIKLALYKSVISQVCRLARTIASPHDGANTVLVAEGCPGRCSVIVKLAAHLCAYTVYQINPSPIHSSIDYKRDQFKMDLVQGYTRAGTKGEKILLLLHEEELVDEDFLVFLTEFIVSGSIMHLFSYEEQTTIINSIRTEVTQAGLAYTRDVAWNFFLKTVRKNFRVCLIASNGGKEFQRRCRNYPSFTKNVNFLWFGHWTKTQLVDHAAYHLKDVKWLNSIQRENIAHMLASMHLVLRQQDGQENSSGEYSHITNTAYEKFVERFISIASCRHKDVNDVQQSVTKTLTNIQRENEVAIKLNKQLEHEMVVLEERKAGTIRILSQIGQDRAITEQQIKVVKHQLEKITKLKTLLPEYQVAHERAVYKAIAIVADTKKVVKNIDIEKLTDLRGMSKPIIDIEDLMTAIIMILKSPSADLTWQKGAKRQMANLERFLEELMTFDDNQLPEETLNLVEPYLKKASFDPETLEKKTNNSACGSLCRWVRGVVRYHRMMLSKVKPLHQKVDETAQQVDIAEHKMNTLESKHKALEIRLADLARGFEEATIDKNEQEEKTVKMKKMLDTAAELRKILRGERKRCQQIFDSFKRRLVAIPGGCAMAAAFAVYLGPYHHNHRREMLTLHWPNCLRERGVPLVVDSIDGIKGRVVDWSINFLKTASGASSVYDVDYGSIQLEQEVADASNQEDQTNMEDPSQEGGEETIPPNTARTERTANTLTQRSDRQTEDGAETTGDTTTRTIESMAEGEEKSDKEKEVTEEKEFDTSQPSGEVEESESGVLERIQEEQEEDAMGSVITESTAPILSVSLYNRYMHSLIKLLVGEKNLTDWLCKDFGPRQIENAAILCSSWQRPPMLIDPTGEGATWLGRLNHLMNDSKLISLDMTNRSDNNVLVTLEKAITRGKPVLLRNCEEHIDNVITPLMHHRNTSAENGSDEDPRMIMFCGRRTLCHQGFRFYMSTPIPKPLFNPEIASTTTMINFGASHDTLTEDLLTRAFARVRTDLYKERRKALKNLQLQKETLYNLSNTVKDRVLSSGQKAIISSPKALQFITDLTEAKLELAQQLSQTQKLLEDLELLRDELYPLARRAAMLYSTLRSLNVIHNEYQFSLAHFIKLFDEAVGGKLPKDFFKNDEKEGYEDGQDTTTWDGSAAPRASSGNQATEKSDGEKQTGQTSDKPAETSSDKVKTSEEVKTSDSTPGVSKNGEPQIQIETQITQQDNGTEGDSVTSTLARKLIATTESDDLPPLDIPDTERLPTEGVQYSSLSINQIKQMMDALTSLVYHRVKQSLYEEDCLLFATLVCLNIQAESGENFSAEEMSLLLQGNPGLGLQLTLADFECLAPPPSWLPKEKWEDILALSVLPGPLDCICVNFAEHPDMWQSWYKSAYPEREPLPVAPPRPPSKEKIEKDEDERSVSRGSERGANYGSPDLGPLSDFHQLLIIRMLRPDRLPAALVRYIDKHLNLNLPAETDSGLADILLDARHHDGILLLLPPKHNKNPVRRLRLTQSPVQSLVNIAKFNDVNIEQVKIGDGCEIYVDEAIDTAEKNDGWVVIEDLHLAPVDFLQNLQSKLQRLKKSRATLSNKKRTSRFCVWLTTEPCEHIPDRLVQNLHKVAWNYLATVNRPSDTKSPDKQANIPTLNYLVPQAYFKTAIVKTLKEVPVEVWDRVREQTQLSKALIFGAAVIQGALRARQLFGSIGMSQWFPYSSVQMIQAIDIITGSMLKIEEGEPNLEDVCYGMAKFLYNCLVVEDIDRIYIDNLTRYILTATYKDPAAEIMLGTTLIPTPPANVDPREYGDWFDKTANEMALESLQLHVSVEKECNDASSVVFVRSLDRMYETQSMEAGDLAVNQLDQIHIPKLRSALDICVEELPPLLELGAVPHQITQEYNFPYHRPSVLSLLSSSSSLMPESIGYVLMQECLWLNSVLCHIRQQISDLQGCLLGGTEALPMSHINTIYCLQEEFVPVSWIHPNCQPCTHALVSWLQDLRKRHQQLHGWVKRGMVPTYKDGVLVENPAIARGQLVSVWLGGLVNPQALLTALRQEKAIISKKSVQQVYFECVVLDSTDTEDFELDEGGVFLTDLYLQGASWSFENDSLSDPSGCLSEVPCIYLRPVAKSDEVDDDEHARDFGGEGEDSRMYQCPVYINKSRQMLVGKFPLNCSPSSDRWVQSRTALVLDPGLPEDGCKKSRSYLMLQKMAPSLSESEEQEEEGENPEGADLGEPGSQTSRSERSEHSQLSYKAMPPQADPLPPGLGLKREAPMVNAENPPANSTQSARRKDSQSNVRPPSESSQKSNTSQKSSASRQSTKSQKSQRASKTSLKSDTGSRGGDHGSEMTHSPTKNVNNNNETKTPVNLPRKSSQSSRGSQGEDRVDGERKSESRRASKSIQQDVPFNEQKRKDSRVSRGSDGGSRKLSKDGLPNPSKDQSEVPLELPRGKEPDREQLERQPVDQRGIEKVFSTESVDQAGQPSHDQPSVQYLGQELHGRNSGPSSGSQLSVEQTASGSTSYYSSTPDSDEETDDDEEEYDSRSEVTQTSSDRGRDRKDHNPMY